ncbi:MAG TPA: phage holin family protein [Solirubrobacterales bacterium]|nr:phage holin family protein [Solirubrobacterales bacterium]
MAARPPATPPPEEEDRTVGELVLDVSERVSILVREEIELAKAEVTEKVGELLKGSVVAIAAGVFVVFALVMLLQAGAWLFNDILGVESAVWAGFLLMGALLLIVAAIAGFAANRAFQKGGPPVPEMALEEAKQTKETLGGEA